jgi:hypothetical protein
MAFDFHSIREQLHPKYFVPERVPSRSKSPSIYLKGAVLKQANRNRDKFLQALEVHPVLAPIARSENREKYASKIQMHTTATYRELFPDLPPSHLRAVVKTVKASLIASTPKPVAAR